MTRLVWTLGLVVAALASAASDATAQGRPGGGSGGGGGGRCGGGMNSSMQSSRSQPPQQSSMSSVRAYQQQAALRAYQQAAAMAMYQAALNQLAAQRNASPSSGSGSVMVSLTSAPRERVTGPDRSPAWGTEYAADQPVRTVTPGATPLALAINPPLHVAYSIAASANLTAKIKEYVAAGEVVLLDEPLKVNVETTARGLTYVRPLEGRYQGKLFVVEERYVK